MPDRLKILLTGANGFIGRNILEQLSDKYNFLTPSHSELELTDATVVEQYLQGNQVDIVLHAANVGGTRKTINLPDQVETNLRMFFNLARCKNYYRRMVFLGSGAEYGKQRDIAKIKETEFDKVVPNDAYGFYKYVCSKYIESADNITNLRIFGLYGKYEDPDIRFISHGLCKVILDLPINIYQNVKFDYVYINDFVAIIDYFLSHQPKQKFYNIGSGQTKDLKFIADAILEICGKTVPINIQKPGWAKEYSCDNSRLQNEIKGFSFTNFNESLSQMLLMYQSQNLDKERFEKDM